MTKQLRLASAVLTDVGRRRERNQDNVTEYIPPEPAILEEKGALFVVCDGMGGHAAGEVAADLGVQTIRDVYFSNHEPDVITGIAQAVKSANDVIYSTARATVEYGGMGTTCVALVVAGGRGYIVNIGDSRAYIMRDGKVRQVTQDHSWVAEQVRGGVITEEQARVHAHRNVITRSLGTLPNITADLFVETLRDGDRILLCSDGLHGYVEEEALHQELMTQPDPDQTVRDLIDMANANGGPDNITAVVVDILEAPDVAGPLPLPVNASTPIEEGETQPLPVPPGAALAASGAAAEAQSAALARAASRGSAGQAKTRRRGGAGLVVLRILEVAAVLLIGLSVWYVGFGPLASQRQADTNAQNALTQAQTSVSSAGSQNPTDALTALATTRAALLKAQANPNLSDSVRAHVQSYLDGQFSAAVRSALGQYETAAGIQRLPVDQNGVAWSFTCQVAAGQDVTLDNLTSLVAVTGTGGAPVVTDGQLLYGVSGGSLYQIVVGLSAGIPQPDAVSCAQVPLAGVASALALAPEGGSFDLLATTSTQGATVERITPATTTTGAAPAVSAQPLVAPDPKAGAPVALLVNGATIYVAFTGGATTASGVWQYTIPAKGAVGAPVVIPTPQAVASMRLAAGTVYLSLADGGLGQLVEQKATSTAPAGLAFQQVSVLAPPPLTLADPSAYTAATPVPSPTTASAGFGPGSTLVTDPYNPDELWLTDTRTPRVIQMVASASGSGVGLTAQYLYPYDPGQFTQMAVGEYATPAAPGVSAGLNPTVYAWNGSELIVLNASEITPTA